MSYMDNRQMIQLGLGKRQIGSVPCVRRSGTDVSVRPLKNRIGEFLIRSSPLRARCSMPQPLGSMSETTVAVTINASVCADWPARDPIHELGFRTQNLRRALSRDYNLYGFVRNDPLSKYDTLGLVTMWDWWFDKSCWKCGPDVTDGLKASKTQVEQRFNNLKQTDPERAVANCDPFFKDWTQSPGFAFNGWDLDSLVWADPRIRGADGISQCPFGRKCSESVTVNGGCYWKWSVNYALFGLMAKLCDASMLQMEAAIVAWKTLKPSDWPQVDNAIDFAKAGYNGFPDSGSVPADDRYKDCKPCDQKYCTSGLGPTWPGEGGRDRRRR